ncbi:MAG: aspartate aminotransferase family protein [Gammaproteobacteria bacterium]|nr:aspartate aminotransferase family protein [Gammaproteobacteria bacterium]
MAGKENLVDIGAKTFMPNYAPTLVLDRGEGSKVWDAAGNEYLDFGTGIAVNSLGHRHPDLVEAMTNQAQKLWHVSNLFFSEPPVRLAEALVEHTFASRVFFCNSGAEANEAAIKLVRKHASKSHPDTKREIVTFEGGFHGRTLATVTATAQPKYHEGFEPLPGGFVYCPFNDFEAVEKAVSKNTCAIMVEPVQGEGGITPARQGFLRHLQELCEANDALLVFDEIQAGMGRTGKFLSYEWEEGVQPDVVTLAKALGGGMPIGALLVGDKASEDLPLGSHGSTFGGNPVVAAVALAALKQLTSPALLANAQRQGERIRESLQKLNERVQIFKDVRGRGMMIGAELVEAHAGKAGAIGAAAQEQGLLILTAGPDVVRMLPPLNLSDADLADGMNRFEKAVDAWLAAG